jgi:hypothetical protein
MTNHTPLDPVAEMSRPTCRRNMEGSQAGAARSEALLEPTRRLFLGHASRGLGLAALAQLLPNSVARGRDRDAGSAVARGLPGVPHFAPRVKRVIFLMQSGAPSQVELFDYKPELERRQGEELPESIRRGQRLTTMTSDQARKPLTPSMFRFERHGECGAYVSELLPATSEIVDDLCFVRSLHTEAINHDPGITMIQTGSEQPGRPSLGSWISYGLGSEDQDLPTFIVLISGGEPGDQPLFGRLWHSAFLPSQHQGIQFRGGREPVLYLDNPPGISRQLRRGMLDLQADLNRQQWVGVGDPEIQARIRQYEQAFRMQAAAPELTAVEDEPQHIFDLYGDEAKQPGTYAANCLLARRMVERGVRFVQLYHRGWDHHHHLPIRIQEKARQTDQASAALVQDLKHRGLLQDTLVIWGGEFGRSAYCQGNLHRDDYGRDHHPRCFTIWMAGGGVRPGMTYGTTDEFSYNVAENPVHVHDLQATLLHLLGIDHERLTYEFQGRDFRLTDIAGEVILPILTHG